MKDRIYGVCTNIKPMFMFRVTGRFYFFEGETDLKFHFIKKCGTESVAQKIIVEMFDIAPKAIIAVTAFRNKAMNMRIPLEIHGTTVRRIAAMDHFVNVSHLSGSGMEGIFNFFIIVCKDFL